MRRESPREKAAGVPTSKTKVANSAPLPGASFYAWNAKICADRAVYWQTSNNPLTAFRRMAPSMPASQAATAVGLFSWMWVAETFVMLTKPVPTML